MPTIYKYCLVVDKDGPTGYMYYSTIEIEVNDEFYQKYGLDDERVHQFDIEEPLGFTFLCSNLAHLQCFIAGLNVGFDIIRSHGVVKSKMFHEFTKEMNKG